MADSEPTAPSGDPRALTQRIAQLAAAVPALRASGRHDVAREVEAEGDTLRTRLAELGGPPILDDAIALLDVVRNALTMPAPMTEKQDPRVLLLERVEWARSVLEAVLMGRQDLHFAAMFLRTQINDSNPSPSLPFRRRRTGPSWEEPARRRSSPRSSGEYRCRRHS
jgi:hypothetical protein